MQIPTATRNGIMAGIAMIIISLLIFHFKKGFDNIFQYINYAIYAGSIILTQKNYARTGPEKHSLKNYFSEGFKTFIVITLLMVIFTRIFISFTPGLTEEAAGLIRNDLLATGNKTAAEIEMQITSYRKNYPNIMTSYIIFGYLAIGALVSLTGGLIFSRRKPGNQ